MRRVELDSPEIVTEEDPVHHGGKGHNVDDIRYHSEAVIKHTAKF